MYPPFTDAPSAKSRFDELRAAALERFGPHAEIIEPVDGPVFWMDLMRDDAGGVGNLLREQVAQLRPLRGDAFQPRELGGGHRGLGLAHPVVGGEAVEPAPLAPVAPLVAIFLQQGAKPLVVRGNDAAVAAGDMLGILEREAGEVSHGADRPAARPRPPGLRTVFDQDQVVAVGQGLQGVQIAGVARQVDRDDRLGLWRDPPLDIGRVEIVRSLAEVGEDGHSLLVNDADDRAHIRDGGRDHLVSQTDPSGGHGDVQRGRTGGTGLDVLHRAELLEAFGEQFGLWSFPVEQRVLLDHRLELGAFRLAPAGLRDGRPS